MQPSRGELRALRAGLLGTVTLLLACVAHVLGGGTLPGAPALAGCAAVAVGVAAAVTARRCRFLPLLAVMGALQLVVHLLLGAATTPTACVAGAGHHAAVTCTGAPATALTHAAPHSAAMLLTHLLATLVTVGVLSRGEAWLWSLADRAVRAAASLPNSPVRPSPTTSTVLAPTPVLAGARSGPAGPRAPPAG